MIKTLFVSSIFAAGVSAFGASAPDMPSDLPQIEGGNAARSSNHKHPNAKCAADYGSYYPCCGQSPPLSSNDLSQTCPPDYPNCEGYVYGKTWGKCHKPQDLRCATDYGAYDVCCGQAPYKGRNNDKDYKCPPQAPTCVGYVTGKTWGSCQGGRSCWAEGDCYYGEVCSCATQGPQARGGGGGNCGGQPGTCQSYQG